VISERHRHRYEVNPEYHKKLQEVGLIISGTSPDGSLVEFIELDQKEHPYFIATQAHPEFKSRPNRAHPLFAGLIAAAIQKKK
jgi:CTP synthase